MCWKIVCQQNDDCWLRIAYFEHFRPTGGAGELINDIFGSSDEDDDEDFEVSNAHKVAIH